MTRRITAQSSLEGLKKEAKRWLKAIRAGEADARRRFEAAHPQPPTAPGLRDVQHALAREHEAESWAALKLQLEDQELAGRTHAERVADFLELACLHYGVRPGTRSYSEDHTDEPARRARAARILARHPEVGRESLHTAVVCGDVAEVTRVLKRAPESVSAKGGREGWEPLLYLCYGRLPSAAAAENAVEIATALLDAGADPNAHWTYDWEHRLMEWSAVCGAVGDGEGGPVNCPPHPRADELARLLLGRGARPNQGQALYNTMLRGDDDRWPRLFIAHGLDARAPISWDGPSAELTMFEYLLDRAVEMGQLRRATTLLEAGASAVPSKGRSFYERALLGGSTEMAELLARHGAPRTALSGREEFRATCMRMDGAAARLLADHPEYLAEAETLLVDEAAKRDLPEVARFLLDLGASPDSQFVGPGGAYRALHQCACMNAAKAAQLLVERGAAVDARDAAFQATPLGWALHTQMPGTIELFSRHTRDIFTLVAGGLLEPLRALLAADPARARIIADAHIGLGRLSADPGETPLFVLPEDEDRAAEIAALLLAHGADAGQRNAAGETAEDKARARGLEEAADLLVAAAR